MEAMAGATRLDIEVVLASAAAGDELSFARIIDAHDDEMYRVCVAIGRDSVIAADAVQAAWTIAWRKLGTVRDPTRLRPWLVAIAVNETKTLLKRRHRRALVEISTGPHEPSGGSDPADDVPLIDLRRTLERLSPDDRALLAMRYVAGFDATELSVALGISPSGTRTRLERLVARLRRELT
jgi:RNA polymerase sigma factor (sigma-70 family)